MTKEDLQYSKEFPLDSSVHIPLFKRSKVEYTATNNSNNNNNVDLYEISQRNFKLLL